MHKKEGLNWFTKAGGQAADPGRRGMTIRLVTQMINMLCEMYVFTCVK